MKWSLADQARHPNETNLDIHYFMPKDGVWNTWLRSRDSPSDDIMVQPKTMEVGGITPISTGPRQLINNTPATPANFASISSVPKPPQPPSATIRPTLLSSLLPKLRWANIGWYYHWGTKQYDFAMGKGTIDPRIREICRDAVATVDWSQVYNNTKADWGESETDWTTWNETYGIWSIFHITRQELTDPLHKEPDAGIVNFYQTKVKYLRLQCFPQDSYSLP